MTHETLNNNINSPDVSKWSEEQKSDFANSFLSDNASDQFIYNIGVQTVSNQFINIPAPLNVSHVSPGPAVQVNPGFNETFDRVSRTLDFTPRSPDAKTEDVTQHILLNETSRSSTYSNNSSDDDVSTWTERERTDFVNSFLSVTDSEPFVYNVGVNTVSNQINNIPAPLNVSHGSSGPAVKVNPELNENSDRDSRRLDFTPGSTPHTIEASPEFSQILARVARILDFTSGAPDPTNEANAEFNQTNPDRISRSLDFTPGSHEDDIDANPELTQTSDRISRSLCFMPGNLVYNNTCADAEPVLLESRESQTGSISSSSCSLAQSQNPGDSIGGDSSTNMLPMLRQLLMRNEPHETSSSPIRNKQPEKPVNESLSNNRVGERHFVLNPTNLRIPRRLKPSIHRTKPSSIVPIESCIGEFSFSEDLSSVIPQNQGEDRAGKSSSTIPIAPNTKEAPLSQNFSSCPSFFSTAIESLSSKMLQNKDEGHTEFQQNLQEIETFNREMKEISRQKCERRKIRQQNKENSEKNVNDFQTSEQRKRKEQNTTREIHDSASVKKRKPSEESANTDDQSSTRIERKESSPQDDQSKYGRMDLSFMLNTP